MKRSNLTVMKPCTRRSLVQRRVQQSTWALLQTVTEPNSAPCCPQQCRQYSVAGMICISRKLQAPCRPLALSRPQALAWSSRVVCCARPKENLLLVLDADRCGASVFQCYLVAAVYYLVLLYSSSENTLVLHLQTVPSKILPNFVHKCSVVSCGQVVRLGNTKFDEEMLALVTCIFCMGGEIHFQVRPVMPCTSSPLQSICGSQHDCMQGRILCQSSSVLHEAVSDLEYYLLDIALDFKPCEVLWVESVTFLQVCISGIILNVFLDNVC